MVLCSGKQLPEWYVFKMAKEINPNIEIISPYTNLTVKIKCRCVKHNVEVNKTMQEILKGQGCYYCGLEKLSHESFLSIDEYQTNVHIKNKNVTVLEYNGMKSNAKFRCNKCGHIWESCASSMTQNGKQCPNCERYYTGEKSISLLLNKWGISFKEQHRFQDCIDKRPLPFDFYLPDYNACIEFDGKQHYIQRDGWTDLHTIQFHDNIKNTYCDKNHIKIIRIPYWEQEDLEYFLFDCLVKYGILEETTKSIA